MFSLFGDHQECNSNEAVKKFLSAAEGPGDDTTINKLVSWLERSLRDVVGNSKTVMVSDSTGSGLANKLSPYTGYAEDEDGHLSVSLTTLVCLTEFHFAHPLTNLRITFLHTPGTMDNNVTRRKSANKYRQRRTHILILTDEARAQDDSSITKEVRFMSRRGMGRAVVVATRSDTISDSCVPPGPRREK